MAPAGPHERLEAGADPPLRSRARTARPRRAPRHASAAAARGPLVRPNRDPALHHKVYLACRRRRRRERHGARLGGRVLDGGQRCQDRGGCGTKWRALRLALILELAHPTACLPRELWSMYRQASERLS